MLHSYRSVHSVQHILTDRLQLANQPFGLCLTLNHELAVSGLAAIVRKAQKVEGLRATLPGSCSALGSEPPNSISRVLPSWTDRPNCISRSLSAARSRFPSASC